MAKTAPHLNILVQYVILIEVSHYPFPSVVFILCTTAAETTLTYSPLCPPGPGGPTGPEGPGGPVNPGWPCLPGSPFWPFNVISQ